MLRANLNSPDKLAVLLEAWLSSPVIRLEACGANGACGGGGAQALALDDELIPTADATVTSLPKSCLRKLDPRRWWRRRQRYLAKIRGCRFSCLQDLEYFKPSCTCALAQCWWKAWCSRKSAKGGSPKGNFAVLEDCRLPGPVPAAPATAAAAAALAGDGKGTQKCAPAPGKFSQLVDCRTLAMPEPHNAVVPVCPATRLYRRVR